MVFFQRGLVNFKKKLMLLGCFNTLGTIFDDNIAAETKYNEK